MSLLTDQFFYNALSNDPTVTAIVGERIYNTARPTVDETDDVVPYIIIMFDGMRNDVQTKDDVEGDEDMVTVSVLCVEQSRDALGELAEAVRRACRRWQHVVSEDESHADYPLCPYDWELSASRVMYDFEKPCLYQTLSYQCSVERNS